MDLKFLHHECELAQNTAHSSKSDSIKYWLHANMLTSNGEKMSKSTGQFFLPQQMFDGTTNLLEKSYSPMVVKFAMMQCHYSSTMDLSNAALATAEKGLAGLKNAFDSLDKVLIGEHSSFDVKPILEDCSSAMNDDFNTPILVAHLFDTVKKINNVVANKSKMTKEDISVLKGLFDDYVVTIMGVELDIEGLSKSDGIEEELIQLAVDVRINAKENKDWKTGDLIRNELADLWVQLKDSKEGTKWSK